MAFQIPLPHPRPVSATIPPKKTRIYNNIRLNLQVLKRVLFFENHL
jgi:hypothetical protein